MSKHLIKKFKKDRYDDDDNENYYGNLPSKDKRKDRRINRALKTKDIESLLENEDVDDYLYDGD